VLALLEDAVPLVAALQRRPTTLIHGDLATVNMAAGKTAGDDGQLTLLDWSMPPSAPGATREEIIADFREASGPAYDEPAPRLALLSGLRQDLDWWVGEGRRTLESGLL